MGLRFILSLNSLCKGVKLYLHEVPDIDILINDKWRKYVGDSSKLQGDLNFAFDQRESEVNLHQATSSPESPFNVSPDFKLVNLT